MTKKRGLGKGLGALINVPPTSQSGDEAEPDNLYRLLPLDDIRPNPHQPRKTIAEDKLEELANSIKTHGLIQPIIVRPKEDQNGYEIIAGERRWRACQKLNLEQVPVLIKEYTDLEASAAAIIENIQREDLNAIEEATAYKKLMHNYGLTQEELSNRLGKSRPFIANMVRLLTLPVEIREMLAEGIISIGHARALVTLKDSETQIKYTLKIIKQGLSVRKTEQLVKKHLDELEKQQEQPADHNNETNEVNWSHELAKRIGHAVKIKTDSKGGGKLIITYGSQHELENLIQKLKKD